MPGLLLVLVAALLIPRQALAQKVYWIDATADKIQRANLDGTNVEDMITTGLTNARYVAIDSAGGKIYWTDSGANKIKRANLDGTGAEDLVTTGLNNARGIALDVAGGKMYWTDKGNLKIQRANLDGSSVQDLVATGGGSDPRGIAVDSAGGKMYWTDRLFDKIQRANLDGTGVEDLVTTGMANSQDIALDVSGGKMYWTDKGSGDVVKRANLDGSSPETLVSGLNNPFGIALDVSGGKMYWCSQAGLKVQRANLDGSSVENLVTTGLSEPQGIALDLGGGGPTLTLADHDPPGQETDAFSDGGGEADAELFAFKLDPGPDTISVTELVFSLSNIENLADLDWVLPELVEDADGDGAISASEASTGVVGGGGTVAGSTITFSSSIPVSSAMNYILRADFPTLANCAAVTIALNAADVQTTATVTGSTTSASHVEGTGCGGGGGGSFTWLTAASDISLTSTDWQDIDLSAFVPAGATGAVVEIANTSSGNVYRAVVRGKEDTRDYMSTASWNAISELVHRYQIVKIDSNRFIQGYINNTSVDFRLLGYTSGSDPSYFALPADITPGTFGSWTTVNVSSEVDADADGVILFIQNQDSANRVYGVRELTSGDITLDMRNERSRMHVVGLDASKEFQAYIQTTAVKIYLVAQTKGSVVYYTNNVAVTDPTTGSWQTLDADNYSVADEANGLFLSVYNSGSVNDMSFRHGDSTDDFSQKKLNGNKGFQAVAGLNAANEWGEYMGNTGLDVSIAAYTKGSGGGGNWMATGTYTGNSPSNQSITGLDFQPDVVFVKRYPNKNAHCRTSTMTGDESKRFIGSNLITDTITLDADGFTVSGTAGPDDFVNQSSEPFHWIAFKATAGLCEVGSYSGTGSSWTVPVAFQPNYVIVMAENGQHPFHRSSEMPADQGAKMEGSGLSTERIKALQAGGFEVGTNSAVNSGGTTYHFVAWKAVANQMEVGSYPGDSSPSRDIAVTFQPKWVIVQANTSVNVEGIPGTVHRPDSMTGNVSINFNWADPSTVFSDCIMALQATGFEVGNSPGVNQTGKTYYWMAFGESASVPPPKPKILKWVEVDPYGP